MSVTADEMVEWFFENYEDPVHSVPYDSGEGGYQYFAGEPDYAEDILAAQFPDANDLEHEKACKEIENSDDGGPLWVSIEAYSGAASKDGDEEDDEGEPISSSEDSISF